MRKADQPKLAQEAQQLTKDWPKVRLGAVLTRSQKLQSLDLTSSIVRSRFDYGVKALSSAVG